MRSCTLALALSFLYASTASAAEQQVTIELIYNGTFYPETVLRIRGYDAGDTAGGIAGDELCPIYTFDRDDGEQPTYEGTDFPYVKVSGTPSWKTSGYGLDLAPIDTNMFSKAADNHLLLNGKPLYRYKDCPSDPYSIPLKELEMTGSSTWEKGRFFAVQHDGESWRQSYTPGVKLAVPNDATRQMINDRVNDPTFGAEDNRGFAAATSLPIWITNFYQGVLADVEQLFGRYNNWYVVVLDPQGTDEENAPVFEVLTEVGYGLWDDEVSQNGWTTQRAVERSGCLMWTEPNGGAAEAGAEYERYSLCILWAENFLQDEQDYFFEVLQLPPLPRGEYYYEWWVHWGLAAVPHEYFHHYQGAHALDRYLHPKDTSVVAPPERDNGSPWWWLEGAAQFYVWHLRDHWTEMEYFDYLNPDSPNYAGYWESLDTWDSIPVPNSAGPYSSLAEHIAYEIKMHNSSFFYAASHVQNDPRKPECAFIMCIAPDESCEDWEASPEDMWWAFDSGDLMITRVDARQLSSARARSLLPIKARGRSLFGTFQRTTMNWVFGARLKNTWA